MKRIVIIICTIVFVALSAFVWNHKKTTSASGIHGIISPADGSKKIWAVNGKDSVATAAVSGNFSIDVKPGTWKLHVEAVSGLKDAYIDNIAVEEGSYADVGEIKLSVSK
jgi:hypothetical protein